MPRIHSDPLAFNRLQMATNEHSAAGRSQSAAFLLWFLQAIYRLDEFEAQDAVCDAPGDMGIDGLTVEDEHQEVVVFQAKWKEKLPGTLGDTDLKKFVGSLASFASEAAVREMIAQTTSGELRGLLEGHDVAAKIGRGYNVHPIFISNVAADSSATAYVQAARASQAPLLDLWDLPRLAPILEQLQKDWFVSEECALRLTRGRFFVSGTPENPELVFAAVSAKELVKLPGIGDTRIFAQNVRLSLGRTRVNREIEKSVRDSSEHSDFLSFHNGLTVVARNMQVSGNVLTMSDYSVCNGCQSLVIFYNNRGALTRKLEVSVRFVRVGPDRDLAHSIAYRTNNQNPVSLRDQGANDSTQVQLKAEYDGYFGTESVYDIKRGAVADGNALSNEFAGQILLALYNRQPWSAHQKYRVFGNLYDDIFRYGITSAHIRLAQSLHDTVVDCVKHISNERIRRYGLTKFIILFLVGEVLRQESDGKKLLDSPLPYLRIGGGAGGDRQARVMEQAGQIAGDVVTELDDFLANTGEDYDYKSQFKSPSAVNEIRSEVLKAYAKDKRRGRATVFKLRS